MQDFINSLTENPHIQQYIGLYVTGAAFIVAVLSFFAYLSHRHKKEERYQKEIFNFYDKEDKRRSFVKNEKDREKFLRMERFLKQNGVYFAYKEKITPDEYGPLRVMIGLLAGIFLGMFMPVLAVPGFVLGYIIPPMLIKQGNDSDNDSMLESIKDIYDILKIQTRNNIHISSALYECYLWAKHPRLKQALYELTMEIQNNGDILAAVQDFREKFNNPYLESLAVSIKQSLETGKAAQIFSDVSKQIDAIDEAILLREEARVERINMIVMTLVYASVIAVIIYFVILVALESFGDIF